MFQQQLSQTYTSASKSQIYIKAGKKMIENMASFARDGLLHVHLAKRAKGYYIETHNLLTVVTPTGLEEKPLFDKDDSNTIYHRTEWDVIPKDWWKTLEDTIRPSGWSRNADNIPNQYPCFGFFGYGAEIVTSSALSDWAVNICTSGLYKIGKGQLPAGLIATCRTPKLNKNMAGGNDQLQRACRREESQKGRTVSLQQIPLPVPLPSLTPSTHHTLQRPHAARPRMRATIADDLPFDLSVHYTIGSWILARLFWMNNMILPLGVASAPNLFREKARFLCYSVHLLIESMFFYS